ncbi:hypothetical protein ACFX2I_027211 [Malus domestica]
MYVYPSAASLSKGGHPGPSGSLQAQSAVKSNACSDFSYKSKPPHRKSRVSSFTSGGAPISKAGFSPRHQEILSPSLLEFPSLTLSPVTPLNDQFDKSASSPSLGNSSSEEDRAIAEKGFYLHPSPRATTTPRDPESRLLPLFPVTSPRVSGSSS